MTEDQDEALGTLRGLVEDVADVSQRLYSRLMSGDIPWDAGTEASAEFCAELETIEKSLRSAEKMLSASLVVEAKSLGEVIP